MQHVSNEIKNNNKKAIKITKCFRNLDKYLVIILNMIYKN